MSWSGGWCTEIRRVTNIIPSVSLTEAEKDNICFKELVVQKSPTEAVGRQLFSCYKSISPAIIAPISKKEEEKDTEEIAVEKDNISVGAPVDKESPIPNRKSNPVDQQENSSNDGFKNSAGSYGSKCLDYPFRLQKESELVPSSVWTGLEEKSLSLDKKVDKKTEENKKSPNKLTNLPPAEKSDSKSLQKHRQEEKHKEEMFCQIWRIMCLECNKIFGFHGSSDDHESENERDEI